MHPVAGGISAPMPPVTVKPPDGGQLVTRASASEAGVAHYVAKRNWRRDLSDEIRREGHDYFAPFGLAEDYLTHPFPSAVSDDDLTLICLVRRPNGDVALVVGTPDTLYRFNHQLSSYIEDEDGYIVSGYFIDQTRWQIIGSGFSESGRRWEVEQLDGTAVFDNGVDIPQAFRVEWDGVQPLYELRDQGVATVGTIGELSGLLLGADIREFTEASAEAALDVISSGSVTLTQAGFKTGVGTYDSGTGSLTAASAVFAASDNGRIILWSNGVRQRITGYTSPTVVTLASGSSVAAALSFRVTDEVLDGWGGAPTGWQAYAITASSAWFDSSFVGTTITFESGVSRKIVAVYSSTVARTDTDYPVAASKALRENPLAYASLDELEDAGVTDFDRRKYRVLWGEVNQATRFGALIPVEFDAASYFIRTDRACRTFKIGDVVGVIGAGINGGTLGPVTVVDIGPGRIRLSKPVITSGSGAIIRFSSIGSTAGFQDLQDNGSGILRMVRLQERIVVFKESNLFVGRYTGLVAAPMDFARVVVPHGRDLHFRHAVVNVQDSQLFYVGRADVFSFDLTSRRPTPVASADLVSNLFFDYADPSEAGVERIFAADNHLTQEVWVVNPFAPADGSLCFDYKYQTVSTTDWSPTAAATVSTIGEDGKAGSDSVFLMGAGNGVLVEYGLRTKKVEHWSDSKTIFSRRDSRPYAAEYLGYTSELVGGLMNFGDPYSEKHFNRYFIGRSSQPQSSLAEITVTFSYAMNEQDPVTELGSAVVSPTDSLGMIPLHLVANYIQDRIVVTGKDNPVRLHQRTFDMKGGSSRSYHRK